MTGFDVRDQEAYDRLQAKLLPLWPSLERLNQEEQTIVVVPSADVDVELPAAVLQAYEERYLFLLFLLRQPRARMIYLTGQRIQPDIVDYYLDLMPGMIASHARRRLFLLSPMEAVFRPLSQKILDRPRLLAEIRSLIPDPDRAHLVPFMTTWADRELAMRLGIPMYGADPKDAALGTKSSGRKLFGEAGVPHPPGREDLHTRDDVIAAIVDIVAEHPEIERVVVKHDEGISGFGNAIVDVAGLPSDPDAVATELRRRLDAIEVAELAGTVDDYFATLEREGGIVEAMVAGEEVRSPSVQLRITPRGDVELLSTHDQILGGPSGQVFIGSRFPADPGYAAAISADARAVGARLAARGVIGRFAIDFVVTRRRDGAWERHAIELNLRKGGTTHPFLTLQFLTDGTYDPESASFIAPSGRAKHYVASDHVEVPGLRGLTPSDLFEVAILEGLHFDKARQVGSVFHMLSALGMSGQVGVTSVGDSPDEAQERFDAVTAALAAAANGAFTG